MMETILSSSCVVMYIVGGRVWGLTDAVVLLLLSPWP